jgi:hypothetical protein
MQVTKEVVSVSQMSRLIGLSRARFYELMKKGIFPLPTRHHESGRPFYDRQQQERCMEVRRTNLGINGKAVLFYSTRPRPLDAPSPDKTQRKRSRKPKPGRQSSVNHFELISELRHGLHQLGVDAADNDIRSALNDACPDGPSGIDPAGLLMSVFERLNRRDRNDSHMK